MITAPSTAANVSYAGWTQLQARATVSRAVCATLAAVGLANGIMRRGSVLWCQ